jgi:nucleotide-binding universal stress UspA family protein
MGFTRILVPVDFSESSLRALEAAQSLASGSGAELHLFHSQQINFAVSSPYAPALPVYYFEDLTRAAADHLHNWRLEHCHSELTVKEHLSELPAANEILNLADELSADLIVMGTRGLTGIKHLLLGSVAERVIQRAGCPVLTIKAEDTADS